MEIETLGTLRRLDPVLYTAVKALWDTLPDRYLKLFLLKCLTLYPVYQEQINSAMIDAGHKAKARGYAEDQVWHYVTDRKLAAEAKVLEERISCLQILQARLKFSPHSHVLSTTEFKEIASRVTKS